MLSGCVYLLVCGAGGGLLRYVENVSDRFEVGCLCICYSSGLGEREEEERGEQVAVINTGGSGM